MSVLGDNDPNKPEEEVNDAEGADTAGDTGDSQPSGATELDLLKSRARIMGITFSNNIGIEALKQKIQAKREESETPPEVSVVTDTSTGTIVQIQPDEPQKPNKVVRPIGARKALQAENLRLVRCRIQNLDPKKKDLPGEIITVANEFIGTIRKFVPYGEVTDNGFHIPYVIYKALRNRKFLNIKVVKKNGREHVEQNMAREFSIELLPQLKPEEIARLAASQAAAGGVSGE